MSCVDISAFAVFIGGITALVIHIIIDEWRHRR